MKTIFETERLIVRHLKEDDISDFFRLESDSEVLKYASGDVKSFEEVKKDLKSICVKYLILNNDFWIFAVERKSDHCFLGTIALVKDDFGNDEIGYRFIREYWNKGYGLEVCKGLIIYAKEKGFKKLIAYVIDKNFASVKIIEKLNFKVVEKIRKNKEIQLPETKYELIL